MDYTVEQTCFDADSLSDTEIEARDTDTDAQERFQPISVLLHRFDVQANEITQAARAD